MLTASGRFVTDASRNLPDIHEILNGYHKMSDALKTAERHWPILALICIALVFFLRFWREPAEAQSIAGLFSFLAAALLIAVTWEYVRTNQETLALMEAQWQEQNKLGLRFGLMRRNDGARVWIANVGLRQFMITKAVIRRRGEKNSVLYKHMIVGPGTVRGFYLPKEIWSSASIMLDVEVSLEYEWQGQVSTTEGKTYQLIIAIGHPRIIRITKGVHGLHSVTCPKCKEFLQMMRTDSLANFHEAEKREKEMESEFAATCPSHASKWILTAEIQRSLNAIDKAQEDREEELG